MRKKKLTFIAALDSQTPAAWDAGFTPRVSGNCTVDTHDLAVTVPEIKGEVMRQIVSACVMSFRRGSPRVTYPRRQLQRQINGKILL